MQVIMTGMIDTKKTLITKSSKMMAFLQLEDLYGVTEVVVFPNVYERCLNAIEVDKVVAVKGTLNFKEEEAPKVLADEVLTIEEAFEKGFSQRGGYRSSQQQNPTAASRPQPQKPAAVSAEAAGNEKPVGMVKVKLTADMNVEVTLEQVKSVLKRHPGKAQVLIYLPEGKTLRTDRQLWAEPDRNLGIQLAAILGKENVKLQRE
jgi:DNA polymerase-3 subunit alpha